MRIRLGIMLALVSGAAFAADMPVKSPAANFLLSPYPYNGSGFYYGGGTTASSEKVVATGSLPSQDAFAIGASIDAVLGYQYGNQNSFFAFEGIFSYRNLGGSTVCVPGTLCNVSSKWDMEQRVLLGGPLANVVNFFPSFGAIFPGLPSTPTLPTTPGAATPVAGNLHPYLSVGIHEEDISASLGLANAQAWRVAPSFGVGILQQWTQGLVGDFGAEYVVPKAGFVLGNNIGGANIGTGQEYRLYYRLKY